MIQLNELKNYLGTGLKCEVEDMEHYPSKKYIDEIMSVYLDDKCVSFKQAPDVYLDEPEIIMKPIVHPLSMLTEEIEHPVTGEKFVPVLKLLELNGKPNRKLERVKLDKGCIYETGFSYGKSVLGLKNTDWLISERLYQGAITLKNAQKLFEWHFDVFDWIGKGLAVDKKETK